MKSKIIDGKEYTELDIANIYVDGNKVEKEFKMENSSVDLLIQLVKPTNSSISKNEDDLTLHTLNIEEAANENKTFEDTLEPNKNEIKNKNSNKYIYYLLTGAIAIIVIQFAIIYFK